MIAAGDTPAAAFFVGEMGIKEARLGAETICARPGSFFYLKLNAENTTDKE